jgi:hypothetical protein
MSKEYIKGECLDTKQKFAEWIAEKNPYYNVHQLRITNDDEYNRWTTNGIELNVYFQAIEKPAPKKLHAYVHQSGQVEYRKSGDLVFGFMQRASEYDLEFNNEI